MSNQPSAHTLPAVDERLVMPDTRYEIIDGEVVYVPPALEPQASCHSKLDAVLEACAVEGYTVACDLLTRTSEKGDMAPDVSIYPSARDPETGGRQLEELAFEVVSTEKLAHAGVKAARLMERGVRRVFAVDVEHQRVLEWCLETGTWEILPHDAVITDRVLVMPLPVRDLVVAARSDDTVARALLAKQNPVLQAAIAKGKAEGKAAALFVVLEARGVQLTAAQARRVAAERDPVRLDRWLAAASTCTSADELLGAG